MSANSGPIAISQLCGAPPDSWDKHVTESQRAETFVPHRSLSAMKASALLHKGLPPADGIYWMRHEGKTSISEVIHGCAYDELEHLILRDEVGACYFWGPITPPDELVNAELLCPSPIPDAK